MCRTTLNDGNKRTGAVAALLFLDLNGIEVIAPPGALQWPVLGSHLSYWKAAARTFRSEIRQLLKDEDASIRSAARQVLSE